MRISNSKAAFVKYPGWMLLGVGCAADNAGTACQEEIIGQYCCVEEHPSLDVPATEAENVKSRFIKVFNERSH